MKRTSLKHLVFLSLMTLSSVLKAQFIVSAHRGNSSARPENTIEAFKSAMRAGANYFECDVRRTKDNVIVALHDATLNRTTNASGRLSNFNYSELANISAGYPSRFGNQFESERIPTLEQALREASGKIKVEIELKESNMADDVVRLVQNLGMTNEVSIISFNLDELRRVKELDASIAVKYLLGPIWWTRQMNQARNIGAEYIGPPGVASKRRVRQARDRGLGIISYTINSERDIRQAIENGQAGIATDYPKLADEIRDGRRAVSSKSGETGTQEEKLIDQELSIENANLEIYPNPTSDKFKVGTKITGKAELSIISLNGEMVYDMGLVDLTGRPSIVIPSSIQSGIYLILVSTPKESFKRRLIIK